MTGCEASIDPLNLKPVCFNVEFFRLTGIVPSRMKD
jgi:hypothetical protein